jgi:hypothetical protein
MPVLQPSRLALISSPMESQISEARPSAAQAACYWLHLRPHAGLPPPAQATAWEVTFLSVPVSENLSSVFSEPSRVLAAGRCTDR